MDYDYMLARQLQQQIDEELCESLKDEQVTISTSGPSNRSRYNQKDKTMSIIDPQWELIDPTPDIHSLFGAFNDRFFWGTLHAVEVRWSPRMTSCAGVCVYQNRAGFCSVRLSRPLLIHRPRKDLVETLLHEMIHAYLFVTHNNRDRDGHGPEFHKHMNRINQDAGTHISVYHTFHAEVRNYQQHVWRCNGPCQSRAPFFGIVRRAMNRAPGPTDNWWAQHKATCDGTFIKQHEPEGYGKKKTEDDKSSSGMQDIRTFFPGSGTSVASKSDSSQKAKASSSSKNEVPKPLNAGFGNLLKPNEGGAPSQGANSGFVKPRIVGFGDLAIASSVTNERTGGHVAYKTSGPNNVVGFKDLQNPVKKQISGGGQFRGGKGHTLGGSQNPVKNQISGGGQFRESKGHTLGGSQKGQKRPNFPKSNDRSPPKKGGGGFGGMLSNRGGGTLVLTGKGNKPLENNTKEIILPHNKPNSSAGSAFQGSGNVLGKGNNSSSASTVTSFSQNNHTVSPSTSSRKEIGMNITFSGGFDQAVKRNETCCPVCNKFVDGDINSHLDVCLQNSLDTTSDRAPSQNNASAPSDVVIISDDEGDDLMNSDGNTPKTDNPKCPICGKEVPADNLDDHLESCASCSLKDVSAAFEDSFSDDEEEDAAVGSPSKLVSDSGERLFPCPCCYSMFEASKMNNHLDSCLSTGTVS